MVLENNFFFFLVSEEGEKKEREKVDTQQKLKSFLKTNDWHGIVNSEKKTTNPFHLYMSSTKVNQNKDYKTIGRVCSSPYSLLRTGGGGEGMNFFFFSLTSTWILINDCR